MNGKVIRHRLIIVTITFIPQLFCVFLRYRIADM